MTNTLIFILSLSIAVAAIIGVIRFNKIDKSYYPFIFSVWISLLVELTTRLLMMGGNKNALAIFYNVYILVDFSLYFMLFYNWKLFGHNKRISLLIGTFILVCWIVTTFFIVGATTPNYIFTIIYSFALVFFSVNAFNKFIVNEKGNIFTNARFWICLGLTIFYTFFIVTNTTSLSVFQLKVSVAFRRNLHEINVFSNLLVNTMYAIAVLWVPRKKHFTSLF